MIHVDQLKKDCVHYICYKLVLLHNLKNMRRLLYFV